MRLIDADAFLKDILTAGIGKTIIEYSESNIGYMIRRRPTIDAVPIRHGQWETNSDRPDTLICSVCKCGFDMWKHDPHNFCPNCGAKMDEVSE